MLTTFMTAVYAGEEAGEVGGVRVLRGRPVEHQEVGELAAQGREHLVRQDQRHEPAAPSRRRREDPAVLLGDRRWLARPGMPVTSAAAELRRVAAAGGPDERGERGLGDRRREQQVLRSPEPRHQPPPSRPPSTAPIGNPAMIRGKLALIPAMSRSRPPCPPMNTKPSWIRIGNSTSSGTDTHAASPPTAMTQASREPDRGAAEHDERDPEEVEPLGRPARPPRTRRSRRPRSRCRSPGARPTRRRRGTCALATMPSSAAIDAERRRPGPSASGRPPSPGAARSVTSSSCRPSARARSRTIATSAAMIPSRERRPVGQQLVEHRLVDPQQRRRLERRDRRGARLGHERGQLADRCAGTQDRDVRVAVVDAEPAAHHGEQVVLHRTLDDDRRPRRRRRPRSRAGRRPPGCGPGRRRTGRPAGARRRARWWSSSWPTTGAGAGASPARRRRAGAARPARRARPGS